MKNLAVHTWALVMAIAIVITMAMGATYAWFTDKEVSGGNVIAAGNFDVNAYWMEGTVNPYGGNAAWIELKGGAVFDNAAWEPGMAEAKHLRIANESTIAIRYKLLIVPTGEVSALADVIDVYFFTTATQYAGDLADAIKVGTLAELIDDEDGAARGIVLPAGSVASDSYEKVGVHDITIVLKMRESAGIQYQGMSIGDNFILAVVATQVAPEADYPDYKNVVSTPEEFDSALGGDMPIKLESSMAAAAPSAGTAKPVSLDLGEQSLTLQNTWTANGDLSIENGSLVLEKAFGYLDLRPQGDATYHFNNVHFNSVYKETTSRLYGTDRVEDMIKLTSLATGNSVEIVFENCVFDNASFETGSIGNTPNVKIVFKNCTFNATTGNGKLIYIGANIEGTLDIIDCTFNIEGTGSNGSSSFAILEVSSFSNALMTVTATNNTLNARPAQPYTFDPEKGETAADNIQIGQYATKSVYLARWQSMRYSTYSESGTVLNTANYENSVAKESVIQ